MRSAKRLLRSWRIWTRRSCTDNLREDCGDSGHGAPAAHARRRDRWRIAGADTSSWLALGRVSTHWCCVSRTQAPARRSSPPRLARREESQLHPLPVTPRLLEVDFGKRAERDNRSAQSVMWRKHRQVTGFVGGRCGRCGTVQFPKSRVCVNPGMPAERHPGGSAAGRSSAGG